MTFVILLHTQKFFGGEIKQTMTFRSLYSNLNKTEKTRIESWRDGVIGWWFSTS